VTAAYLGPPGSTATPPPAPTAAPTVGPRPSVGPKPSGGPAPSPAASGAPGGTTVSVNDDGSFSTPLELKQGRWAITITATSDTGKTASLTRTVTVAYQGVTVVIQIKGGNAWVKVWIDGVLAQGFSSGQTYHPGKTVTFTGKQSIEVRSGSSGNTFFTVNGVVLGSFGKVGVPETWLFAPPNQPVQTTRR
jgi:hypothetical protein